MMDKLRLHSLEEVPAISKEYLLVRNVMNNLDMKIANYNEIEHWLGNHITHNGWLRIMDEIAACEEIGQYTRFELTQGGSQVLVIRTNHLEAELLGDFIS